MLRCILQSLCCVYGAALVWTLASVAVVSNCQGDEPPAANAVPGDSIATLQPDTTTRFSNAGWKYDRYQDLPSLDAHSSMTVADLTGPGIIRHIHTTRHQPADLAARGVILEIYFDDATEPAVSCPLADFFGDGCNGQSMYFSTPWIECAPWSYNCYFPMPFAKHAKVVLRNDTDQDLANYSYVEWEPLAQWPERQGYFHATFLRRRFQLSKDTKVEFFHAKGTGHILGRQLSVATAEPLFDSFNVVMEGNNEIDIDGTERALDYLGTEDSFTFSWGFQEPFVGLRAGMPYVRTGSPAFLSIYRFHDHQPIRFREEVSWSINWREERSFTGLPAWGKRVAVDGCWVQYDAVYYWYQDQPAGYTHEPLPPLADRRSMLTRSSRPTVELEELISNTPLDTSLANTFDSADDLERVHISGCYEGTHPFWIDIPAAVGGHPGNPPPGRQGILAVHAKDELTPAIITRKVELPAGSDKKLRLVVSGDPYEAPGKSDFLMDVGVHDGQVVYWWPTVIVTPDDAPWESGWQTREYPLAPYAGKTITVIVKVSYGGPRGVCNEEAFFDEIGIE